MSYKLTDGGVQLDGAFIPTDERNADWRKYLDWVALGNTPEPADPQPVRETSLTPSQQIILADGVDVARVTITGEPSATIEYTINGSPFSTSLDGVGQDVLELTCDTPNTTLLVVAGTARAVIFAVEVPS